MGEIAEMMIDEMLDPVASDYINFDIWYDSIGRRFNINEMTDIHLRNCINMLNRGNTP